MGAFSLAGVTRHLAVLFMLPVSGLAAILLFFFFLLLLLKGREEEGSTTLQPCPWAKSVSSCRLMRVIRLPRLTAFSLPEAISNRTIFELTEMATEASFTDRRMLGICEVCFLPISSNFFKFCRFLGGWSLTEAN